MIKGHEISDPTRNFTANEWTSLGWNGGKAYVAQALECMGRRGRGGKCGGRDGGRRYRSGGSP